MCSSSGRSIGSKSICKKSVLVEDLGSQSKLYWTKEETYVKKKKNELLPSPVAHLVSVEIGAGGAPW